MIELRHQHPLSGLLKVAALSRSTFYYQQKVLQVADKYADVKDHIRAIYNQHKGRYGYRQITAMLRIGGRSINHKTVQRLMGQTPSEVLRTHQKVPRIQRPVGTRCAEPPGSKL